MDYYHGATRYDGNNIEAYLNGNIDGTIPKGGNLSSGIDCASIGFSTASGCALDGSQTYFDGQIDDVRIYSRALAPTEISELYRMDTSSAVNTSGFLTAAP